MTAKLKRCPFCNGHNLTMDRTQLFSQLRCRTCGSMGPTAFGEDSGAVRKWNNGEKGSTAMVNMNRRYTNRDDLKKIDF